MTVARTIGDAARAAKSTAAIALKNRASAAQLVDNAGSLRKGATTFLDKVRTV